MRARPFFITSGFTVLAGSLAAAALGAPAALWLRFSVISPDGSTLAASFRGDLWKVFARGGTAVPLTVHPAHEDAPVWSPDGSYIAFASDRYGNFDVFVMPASGGEAIRLAVAVAADVRTNLLSEVELEQLKEKEKEEDATKDEDKKWAVSGRKRRRRKTARTRPSSCPTR